MKPTTRPLSVKLLLAAGCGDSAAMGTVLARCETISGKVAAATLAGVELPEEKAVLKWLRFLFSGSSMLGQAATISLFGAVYPLVARHCWAEALSFVIPKPNHGH